MNNNKKIISSIILLSASLYLITTDRVMLAQDTLISKLKGKILLQVEEYGEAWYVNPINQKRYYLGRPDDAYDLMRNLSIGISNQDIKQIQVAEANLEGIDSDNDGLSDAIENSFGTNLYQDDTDGDGYSDKIEILNNYNPLGPGKLATNTEKAKNLGGMIVLQVEQNGEAWYINPDNLKRYYLGRPTDAFNLMHDLGLGITNNNLAKIEQNQINPEYKSETIAKKYTMPIKEHTNIRQYKDPNNDYTLEYPSNWTFKKYEGSGNVTYLTDAEKDFIIEKKGVIIISYFKTNEGLKDLSVFRIATKGSSRTISDENKNINNKEAYENSYEHKMAYEKTTTIQINPNRFVQISLITAKYNDNYYIEIYNNLLKSLEFAEAICESCQ